LFFIYVGETDPPLEDALVADVFDSREREPVVLVPPPDMLAMEEMDVDDDGEYIWLWFVFACRSCKLPFLPLSLCTGPSPSPYPSRLPFLTRAPTPTPIPIAWSRLPFLLCGGDVWPRPEKPGSVNPNGDLARPPPLGVGDRGEGARARRPASWI
jgi:hypothetical protein